MSEQSLNPAQPNVHSGAPLPEGMVIAGMNPDGTSRLEAAGPTKQMQEFGGYATGTRLTETAGAVFQAGKGAIHREPAGFAAESGAEAVDETPASEAAGEAAMSGAVEPVTIEAAQTPAPAPKGPRDGHPYFPPAAPTDAEIARGKAHGFDLKQQEKYYS